MSTQTLLGFRQTVSGLLRSNPRSAAKAPRNSTSAAVAETTSAEQLEAKTVDNNFLNMLLLAMFSNASRMDSFGNFR